MREELAQLASEEIFSTEARLAVAATALDRLRTDLLEFHCLPDQVLIRAVRFPDGYEGPRLQEKQLTYQKLELAVSKRAVEDQTAITDTSAAEISAAEKELRGDWDKRLQTSMSENAVAIASIVAEANIYDQQTRAEAGRALRDVHRQRQPRHPEGGGPAKRAAQPGRSTPGAAGSTSPRRRPRTSSSRASPSTATTRGSPRSSISAR